MVLGPATHHEGAARSYRSHDGYDESNNSQSTATTGSTDSPSRTGGASRSVRASGTGGASRSSRTSATGGASGASGTGRAFGARGTCGARFTGSSARSGGSRSASGSGGTGLAGGPSGASGASGARDRLSGQDGGRRQINYIATIRLPGPCLRSFGLGDHEHDFFADKSPARGLGALQGIGAVGRSGQRHLFTVDPSGHGSPIGSGGAVPGDSPTEYRRQRWLRLSQDHSRDGQ